MFTAYYESYRKSAMRDLLPGFQDHARTLPGGLHCKSMFEFLQYVTTELKAASEGTCRSTFYEWLIEHQGCIKELLKSMMKKDISSMEYGWKGYKFTGIADGIWDGLPLYTEYIPELFQKRAIFADELARASELPNKEDQTNIVKTITDIKRKKPCFAYIIPEQRILRLIDLNKMNVGEVHDWTGELRI